MIISIVIVYILSALTCYNILKYGHEHGLTDAEFPIWSAYFPIVNTFMCLVTFLAIIVSLFKYLTK